VRLRSPLPRDDLALSDLARIALFCAVEAVPVVWAALLGHVPLSVFVMSQVMAAFALLEYFVRSLLHVAEVALKGCVRIVRWYRRLRRELDDR
jgi:hypothetical protein